MTIYIFTKSLLYIAGYMSPVIGGMAVVAWVMTKQTREATQ